MGSVAGTRASGALWRWMAAWALALVAGLAAPAMAQAAPEDSWGMSGTVGRQPVAVIMEVLGPTRIGAAHYSYARWKTPIPLTGRVEGEQVILTEPGGGLFRLRFTDDDRSRAKRPLTFMTALGLEGTWTRQGVALPAKLHFVDNGLPRPDCAYYPPPPQPAAGPRFPNPGCTHTLDRAAIEGCIGRPFTSDAAVSACVEAAMKPCGDTQYDINFCVGNLGAYLDQTVMRRLRAPARKGALDARGYRAWERSRRKTCEANSPYSPDGSGYGSDIALCLSQETLRLLQTRLVPKREPFPAEAF